MPNFVNMLKNVAGSAPPGTIGDGIAMKGAARGVAGAGLSAASLAAQYKSTDLQGLAKIGGNEYAMEKSAQREMAANDAGMNVLARTNMQQIQLRSQQSALSSLANFAEAAAKISQKTSSNIAQAV